MEIASKRPAWMAGFLVLLAFSTQEGCRCRRTRPTGATDGGAAAAATAWLSGSVVDRREHPVPEARVLAFPLAGDGGAPLPSAPLETATDLGGHFRFAHLAPGAYRLLVEAAGFPTAEVTPV